MPTPRRIGRAQRQRRVALTAAIVTAAGILCLAAAAVWLSGGGRSPSGMPAGASVLVVVPFTSAQPDSESAGLGVGLAESIISRLSEARGLTVRSLSESLGAGGEGIGPLQIGRRLGAASVLGGEYRLEGESLQVTARLTDVETGAALWEQATEGSVRDLVAMERKVVSQTLAALVPPPPGQAPESPEPRRQRDDRAHYLFLMARGRMATYQSSAYPQAVGLLEQAIAIDPDDAITHAELARASAGMVLSCLSSDPGWLDRALAAGRRAVWLAEDRSRTHQALGGALLAAGKPVAAAREVVRALQLDPGNAHAMRLLAGMLGGAGDAAPLKALMAAARQADPTMDTGWIDAFITMIEGDYEAQMAAMESDLARRRAAGISIEAPVMRLGYLAFESGDPAAGLRWAAMLETLSVDPCHADLIHLLALARMGDEPGVRRIVAKNLDFYTLMWERCELIGRAFVLLGDREEALAWFERSVERGNFDPGTWERSRILDDLRGNPRFEAALAAARQRSRDIVQIAEYAGYR